MPPSKRMSKGRGSKKGKRSHSEFSAEYDSFPFTNLDVDESEELEPEELDAAYRLDSPSMDSLSAAHSGLQQQQQQQHSAHAADIQLSKDGTKVKLKQSKSSGLSSSSPAPFFSSSSSFLSFQHHPAALLSFAAHSSKALNQLDLEDLKALARDLHALQRESRDRALATETELRKLHEARGGADGAAGIESEEFYQNAIKWLHGIDVTDDPLGDDSAAVMSIEQRRKKGARGGDDDGDGDYGSKRRNKKQHPTRKSASSAASEAAGASDSDAADGFDSSDESRPKKALTAKEKTTALRDFWESVDGWMAFPTREHCDAIREQPEQPADSVSYGSAGSYWARELKEKEWKEEREREREREREKEREREREREREARGDKEKDAKRRKKEKKREKERKEKERERQQKDNKKLAEAQRLGLFFIDDPKLRKSVIDTDRQLQGIVTPQPAASTAAGAQQQQQQAGSPPSLLQRVLACFIEQTGGAGRVVPYVTPALPKKPKKKDKSKSSLSSLSSASLDERLRLELKALGILSSCNLQRDYSERVDDEVCAGIRQHSAELRQMLNVTNVTRRQLHPLGVRLIDHTARLQLLGEAEAALHKQYKKKKISDATAQKAVEAFVQTQQRVGSRRRITGFIPHPQDMKGVPRCIADAVVSHPSYRDVLMADELPPLQPQQPAYVFNRYSRGSGGASDTPYRGSGSHGQHALLPPSSLPPLLSQLASPGFSPGGNGGYFGGGSPLPAFSSHNSPLALEEHGGAGGGGAGGGPASPVRGGGVEDGDGVGGGGGSGRGANGTTGGGDGLGMELYVGSLPEPENVFF